MSAIIGTWRMSLEGIRLGWEHLQHGGSAADAVERAVCAVEDEPAFTSVGYGGLPAKDGHVRLDAGWMDGNTLRVGAVMHTEGIANPVKAARMLCGRARNCVLAGDGAEAFARRMGLPMRDMLTPSSREAWQNALKDQHTGPMDAYREHDTVCVLAVDGQGQMIAGTSTSGLFMKEIGRVGDSPMPGCGYYCDARYGAAAATGVGEDIMRGCLSYETVALMRQGLSPADACALSLRRLTERTRALGEPDPSISLIALSPDGTGGAATTLPIFPYVLGDSRVKLMVTGADGLARETSPEKISPEP